MDIVIRCICSCQVNLLVFATGRSIQVPPPHFNLIYRRTMCFKALHAYYIFTIITCYMT